jgi:hypothetical protein
LSTYLPANMILHFCANFVYNGEPGSLKFETENERENGGWVPRSSSECGILLFKVPDPAQKIRAGMLIHVMDQWVY